MLGPDDDNGVNAGPTGWVAPAELHAISRSSPTRWREVALAIARAIGEGALQPGARLPSEHALAESYRVNRHTVRQALARLVEVGWLEVRRGRGSFVRARAIDYPLTLHTRFSRNLGEYASRALRELIDLQWTTDREWTTALGLEPGMRARCLKIRSSLFGHPLSVSESAFASPRFDGIADLFSQTRSLGLALERLGVRGYQRRRSTISSRLPTAIEAEWLQRPPAAPVLVVDFLNVDIDGLPIEAGRSVFAADAIHLVVEP
ncbi:MAG: phosphonate metabolism transcriptional regulator PhnF [Lautropia sp.]